MYTGASVFYTRPLIMNPEKKAKTTLQVSQNSTTSVAPDDLFSLAMCPEVARLVVEFLAVKVMEENELPDLQALSLNPTNRVQERNGMRRRFGFLFGATLLRGVNRRMCHVVDDIFRRLCNGTALYQRDPICTTLLKKNPRYIPLFESESKLDFALTPLRTTERRMCRYDIIKFARRVFNFASKDVTLAHVDVPETSDYMDFSMPFVSAVTFLPGKYPQEAEIKRSSYVKLRGDGISQIPFRNGSAPANFIISDAVDVVMQDIGITPVTVRAGEHCIVEQEFGFNCVRVETDVAARHSKTFVQKDAHTVDVNNDANVICVSSPKYNVVKPIKVRINSNVRQISFYTCDSRTGCPVVFEIGHRGTIGKAMVCMFNGTPPDDLRYMQQVINHTERVEVMLHRKDQGRMPAIKFSATNTSIFIMEGIFYASHRHEKDAVHMRYKNLLGQLLSLDAISQLGRDCTVCFEGFIPDPDTHRRLISRGIGINFKAYQAFTANHREYCEMCRANGISF